MTYGTFYQSQFFLQVLEPRFNVETMAQLLNIPPNKTLLRRHLATHFNLLIGAEAQHQKRDAMELPDYVLLTATAKVKVGSCDRCGVRAEAPSSHPLESCSVLWMR